MSASFLSTNWYRVAKLRPRLRRQVTIHRHRYRGQAWYVLHDRVSNKTHRVTPEVYLFVGRMDGKTTVDTLWAQVAEELGEHAPSQDEIVTLLAQFHANDLILTGTSPDAEELFERYTKQSRQLWKQNITNPVSFRVPLWDPDRFLARTLPLVRPLIGPFGALLSLAIILAALIVAGTRWNELTQNASDQILAASNLMIMAACYPFVKALHELGHGYVAKAYGAEVREMGIMFLVFFPVPYVDASGATAFKSKWRRAAVSAAGIWVEAFIASLALFIWSAVEPGTVRAVAYSVILIAGFSTIVVNGNPLLRFDGYYVMADVLELPNLGQRANRYLAHLVERYLFRILPKPNFNATASERAIFLAYAPAAFVYRLVIMVGIGLLIASQLFIFGILFAIWSFFNVAIKPIVKGYWYVFTNPRLRRRRTRAVSFATGGALAVALLLFLLPVPFTTISEGVVWLPERAHVRAGSSGFVERLEIAPRSRVAVGTRLLQLTDPIMDARIAALRARVRELDVQLAADKVTDIAKAQITRVERDEEVDRLAEEERKLQSMNIIAGMDGVFVPVVPAEDLPGRFTKEGDLIGYVVPDEATTARVAVTQADIDLVRARLSSIRLLSVGSRAEEVSTRLMREVPAGQYVLPTKALGQAGGGNVPVDPRDPDGVKALRRVFQFDLDLPEATRTSKFGSRVYVKFDHGWEPAGWQAYRRVRQLFLEWFDV